MVDTQLIKCVFCLESKNKNIIIFYYLLDTNLYVLPCGCLCCGKCGNDKFKDQNGACAFCQEPIDLGSIEDISSPEKKQEYLKVIEKLSSSTENFFNQCNFIYTNLDNKISALGNINEKITNELLKLQEGKEKYEDIKEKYEAALKQIRNLLNENKKLKEENKKYLEYFNTINKRMNPNQTSNRRQEPSSNSSFINQISLPNQMSLERNSPLMNSRTQGQMKNNSNFNSMFQKKNNPLGSFALASTAKDSGDKKSPFNKNYTSDYMSTHANKKNLGNNQFNTSFQKNNNIFGRQNFNQYSMQNAGMMNKNLTAYSTERKRDPSGKSAPRTPSRDNPFQRSSGYDHFNGGYEMRVPQGSIADPRRSNRMNQTMNDEILKTEIRSNRMERHYFNGYQRSSLRNHSINSNSDYSME
ncbi:MAG: hypothetical protein MJ252_30950 [archaeon]|nr:hypothetical protein [archaeon]